MNTIENLTGDLNASGTFTETYGVLTPLIWEHPDQAGWVVQVTMGYGGIKLTQGTTAVAIEFADLFALATTEVPALLPVLPTPTASPTEGAAPQTVTLACSQAGVEIRYTLDGSTPTAASTLYEAPVAVATAATLKAKAFKTYWQPSALGTWSFT